MIFNPGDVPIFLSQWVSYCKGLAPNELPNYQLLHNFVDRGQSTSFPIVAQQLVPRQPVAKYNNSVELQHMALICAEE